MKNVDLLGSKIPRLADLPFWDRCGRQAGILLLLLVCLCTGILAGSFLPLVPGPFSEVLVFPLFFSGIPSLDSGFLVCFSTLLLNLLIFLTLFFLLGFTTFGKFLIPLFLFLKGISVGLGVFSFLQTDGFPGLGISALIYTPAAAASAILFLLFGLRALVFSDRLGKAGFSPGGEALDFSAYRKDYFCFLCFSVPVSFTGSVLAFLSSVFLF